MQHLWNAAGIVVFLEDRIALVYLKERRAWDIIFGKVEPGETPEETIRREAYEEGGIILEDVIRPIYSFRDSHGDNIVFVGDVLEIRQIPCGFETSEMRLFLPPQAIELSAQYMPVNRLLITVALKLRPMTRKRLKVSNGIA